MPEIPNKRMNTMPEVIKRTGNLLAFHEKEVIFNENIGSSDTKSNEVTTTVTDTQNNKTTGGMDVNNTATCGKKPIDA